MKTADMNMSQLLTALNDYKGHLTLYRQQDKTWCSELMVDATLRHEAHGPTLAESLRRLLEQIRLHEMFA